MHFVLRRPGVGPSPRRERRRVRRARPSATPRESPSGSRAVGAAQGIEIHTRTVRVLIRALAKFVSNSIKMCVLQKYAAERRSFSARKLQPNAVEGNGTILAQLSGEIEPLFSPTVRLLLLEDNVDAAASLAEALTLLDSNYEIHRVTQLREAEDVVQKERLEVALIDLTLPDADGCEAAIALRRVAPHLPLVALTGKEFEQVAIELVRIGVQDFLQKGTTSVERIHQVLQLAVERHRQESALRRAASFDALTGALNRSELFRQLNKAISHANRSVYRGAVMIIDIDDFKQINDTLGHKAGDLVLKDVAARLSAVARVGDSIGRLGGDEFVLILEGLRSREDAAAAAKKASETTSYELELDGNRVPVSTSIGVAVFPDQGDEAEALLELADRAMYAAKRKGKRQYCFYASRQVNGGGAST